MKMHYSAYLETETQKLLYARAHTQDAAMMAAVALYNAAVDWMGAPIPVKTSRGLWRIVVEDENGSPFAWLGDAKP